MGSKIKIVILQRGWVVIGRRTKENSESIRLDGAHVIRIWGTSKGLGELINGPLASTKIDPTGVIRFHPLTAIATIDVKDAAWEKICS